MLNRVRCSAAAYNADMSSSTREYMDAVEHLPQGATLVLQRLTWEDYERLVSDLTASRARLRVTHDHGRVEIMSPLNEHEGYARFIDALVRAFAEHGNVIRRQEGPITLLPTVRKLLLSNSRKQCVAGNATGNDRESVTAQ